ncbi:MAG: FAD-binding oxidoreductase [Caldilineaceae bacterium]
MDYVIIGGGIYGAATAFELSKRGAEVLLLEAKDIAGGASGGPGRRGVRANGRDLRELPLMQLAYARWPSLHEEIGAVTGYARCGHLLLIERERDLAAAAAHVWAQEKQGIPTRLVQGQELRDMEPQLGEAVLAALYCPLDGVADHTATTRGMAQAAAKLGAQIREQCAVTDFEVQNGRIQAVITSKGERIAVGKQVLLLSNAHVAQALTAHFQCTLPVWTMLPQVLFTAPLAPMPIRHLIGHASRTLAIKPHPDGRVMISGGWRGKWNAELGRGETVPEQVLGNLAQAQAVYPCLHEVEVDEANAARLETLSFDNIPIIDKIPGVDNALFATGWSGHGWAIAPAVARLLAAWAMDNVLPDLLRPFSLERFG